MWIIYFETCIAYMNEKTFMNLLNFYDLSFHRSESFPHLGLSQHNTDIRGAE